ncbi:ATP-dependent zinc metalloprotease FtsH [Thiococcus pfennigii]|uniref:ATP-dependent zinc metalloprotease FtsH n=1 Tax=Thiococcus pfennigii TaxID=1057 RepID=UPI001908FD32|nr:ATP-dependent zinc metalloprotease FtsH [Thiococcus pfennigii]MBK1731855.1 cell division protein FtsH [Thiococcus pfennigii]
MSNEQYAKDPRPPEDGNGNRRRRDLLIAAAALVVFSVFLMPFLRPGHAELSYTAFKQAVRDGRVNRVVFEGDQIRGHILDARPVQQEPAVGGGAPRTEGAPDDQTGPAGEPFTSTMPQIEDRELLALLEKKGVEIAAEPAQSGIWGQLLVGILPWVLLLGAFFYLSYRMQRRMMGGDGGDGGGIFGFAKSKAKRFRAEESEIGLDEVAGLQNAKADLREIIDHLSDPQRFRALGATMPKGLLLVGPPGTGKTLLARAVAGQAGVPFFSISGSEFVEMFVGVGASRVRDMFEAAKKEAPCVIFIDEIDAVGRSRGAGLGGGHDEREQTLNQILSEMDGFTPNEDVVVLAATNRPDVLDKALLRPGRFDRKVYLELPDRDARLAILKLHGRRISLAEDADLGLIAARTVGFSGADLENLVNEAALLAGRARKEEVDMEDLAAARDKLVLGAERDQDIGEEERRLVAYHESGHALMAWLLPNADPLDKVTIIPRGRALGATEQLPDEDRRTYKQRYLKDRIGVMLGGRIAEQLIFDEVTTGAEADLSQATELARRMVCRWGMSERIGPVSWKDDDSPVFLGREMGQGPNYSDATGQLIDDEIKGLIEDIEQKARKLMSNNRSHLERLAEALVESETLGRERIGELLEGPPAKMRRVGAGG